jgi:hypothetical protein
MRRISTILTAILLASTLSVAAETADGYRSYGPGQQDEQFCGAWLETYTGSPASIVDSVWLAGFLTAWNAATPGIYDATRNNLGADNFINLVYKQCRAYPDMSIAEAANTIAHRLTDRQLGTAS